MAKKTIIICDLCKNETCDELVRLSFKRSHKPANAYEICNSCYTSLCGKLTSSTVVGSTNNETLTTSKTLEESGQLTKEYSIPSEPEISVQITAEELNAKHTDCSHINKDAPFYGTLPNGKRGMMRRCRACSDLLPVRSAKDQKEYLSLKTPQGFNVKEI